MEKHLLNAIKTDFPDWEEWIGELYLQWPEIDEARRLCHSKAARWDLVRAACARVRREVRNEGRPPGLFYCGDMREFNE